MERLTRVKDEFECRMLGTCPVEEWIRNCLKLNLDKAKENVCTRCPFEKYINRLADYEDCLDSMVQCVKLVEKTVEDDKIAPLFE